MRLYLALCPYWLASGTRMHVSIGTRIMALDLEFPLFREDIGKGKECEFICLVTSICIFKKIRFFENLHFYPEKIALSSLLCLKKYTHYRKSLILQTSCFFLWVFKNQIKVENKIEHYSPSSVLQIFLIDFFPVQEPLFLIVLVIRE